MSETKRRSGLLEFALIFAAAYLLSQFILRMYFPSEEPNVSLPPVTLEAQSESVRLGSYPTVRIHNNAEKELKVADRCPQAPFDIYRVENPGEKGESLTPLKTGESVDCLAIDPIPAGSSADVSLAPWKYALFTELGTYEVRMPDAKADKAGSGTVARFAVTEPNLMIKLFRTFITKPFLNFLVLIASVSPGYNLGIAIIVLTIVTKLLLYYPTQKSLEGQRKMQLMQPKLDELKRRHKGDQKKLQEETVKLWKEHKVNPFSSCLPILIQFPILIGLFYVIQDGTHLQLSKEFLYPVYKNLPWEFGTTFLGLDLTVPDWYVMPILLVVLQFLQMKLSFAQAQKKKDAAPPVLDAETGKPLPAGPEAMQQKVMLYALPLMIGFFAFQFPAAVSLYYGVSTIFGIGQQVVVNRKTTHL